MPLVDLIIGVVALLTLCVTTVGIVEAINAARKNPRDAAVLVALLLGCYLLGHFLRTLGR
jgi:hypothetical protein